MACPGPLTCTPVGTCTCNYPVRSHRFGCHGKDSPPDTHHYLKQNTNTESANAFCYIDVYVSVVTYWLFVFICFFNAVVIGYIFYRHYPMNLKSLGHCMCTEERYRMQLDSNPESTTLPMSYALAIQNV